MFFRLCLNLQVAEVVVALVAVVLVHARDVPVLAPALVGAARS